MTTPDGMGRFQNLPEEVSNNIFSFLDSADTLSGRRVCREWRSRLVGSAYISCTNGTDSNPICNVLLKGLRKPIGNGPSDKELDKRMRHGVGRTKGHLPEPLVLSIGTHFTTEAPFDFTRVGNDGVAFRMEQSNNRWVWDSLDLSTSSCLMHRLVRRSPTSSPQFHRVKPLLKRVICQVDLSGIRHLQRLSLRGCGSLQKLQLPTSLVALDASNCSQLTQISYPYGQKAKLQSLNLRGCRSLVASDRRRLFGTATRDVMHHLQDLDLGSTNMLGKAIIAEALSFTCCLENLSLRYVASDDAMSALAEAVSSKQTLQLVDVSFSSNLTDSSCETLMNSASHLERFNLRGCTAVSAACYNAIPLELARRKGGQSDGGSSFSVTEAPAFQRKGDNLFHFP